MKLEGKYLNNHNIDTTKRIVVKVGILCRDIIKELYSFSKVFTREIMNIYRSIGPELDEWSDIIKGDEKDGTKRISQKKGKSGKNSREV